MPEEKKDNKKESNNSTQSTIKTFIITFLANTLGAMIIWPLLDFLFSKIENTTYTWTVNDGIWEPCIFGIIFSIVELVCFGFFRKQK